MKFRNLGQGRVLGAGVAKAKKAGKSATITKRVKGSQRFCRCGQGAYGKGEAREEEDTAEELKKKGKHFH
jgi:hypothetical protein